MQIHLPAALTVKIFTYLDGFSLLQAAQVCKNWNAVADREILWRRLCLRKWYFNDVTREHLCTQMWPHLGAQTWKQFFLRRTKRERCMERARPEDFVYREIPGSFGTFSGIEYLSGSGLSVDGQGKSILCSVSDRGILSTWDVQKGIKIWSSPEQQSIITNLATIPEMQLAITVDAETTIKVWNCQDTDSLATLHKPGGCYSLKAFVTKNVPFLVVGDHEGDIYTFKLPQLSHLSKLKAFDCDVQQLQCSPENKWVFACKIYPRAFPKVFLTDCFLRPSEYSSPLYVCLPFQSCHGACWTPRRENRITLMYQKDSRSRTGFITFDLGLETICGKEVVVAQQIAKFLLPAHINSPKSMGISDANVIVFGSGSCLFLYTIDGFQLHRIEDHKRDIETLWVDSLHVLSTAVNGSLHVYMWDEGGRHLKSCCHLKHMRKRLSSLNCVYNTTCDNVSIVRVMSRIYDANVLQIYTLNIRTLQN